jgi:hypothetical protein
VPPTAEGRGRPRGIDGGGGGGADEARRPKVEALGSVYSQPYRSLSESSRYGSEPITRIGFSESAISPQSRSPTLGRQGV